MNLPLLEEEDVERRALAVALAETEADSVTIPHEKVRPWLMRLAAGEIDAASPTE